MNEVKEIENLNMIRGVSDIYSTPVFEIHERFRPRTTIKILVVVDGPVSLTEGPSAFGIGRVIRLLQETKVGCNKFEVDTARRENNSSGSPTYKNFRFDKKKNNKLIINSYDEIWCFGFNPDNFAGPDSNITHASALPASHSELKALTGWMNKRKGGLLAMGDHDYLGASMCHKIPRIRSMRRWTNAQNVPPIGGINNPDTHLRHDTNQPFTAGQIAGTDIIPFSNQEDSKPQKISWVPWMSKKYTFFQVRRRPHPILCHPVHGPIDVMPDHPHEGWCYENNEIDLDKNLGIKGLSGKEYPTDSNGNQPYPTVIAHGTTTPNPPYLLAKGASPEKRFGMISVYDGHSVDVGRVATDSTWHHWFDENIYAIEAAGGENWDKISRYFLNVALWLAPPTISKYCFTLAILNTHFTYLGFQEYHSRASVFDLGKSLQVHLKKYYGPCWVTSYVFELIREIDNDLWAYLKDKLFWKEGIPFPDDDPFLSGLSFELMEIAVLGGLIKASLPTAEKIKQRVAKNSKSKLRVSPDSLVKEQLEGVKIGLDEYRESLSRSMERMEPMLNIGKNSSKKDK